MFDSVRIFSELRDHSTDGTCNSLPGWEISFEPQTGKDDPDCRAFSDFGERGLGAGITEFWNLALYENVRPYSPWNKEYIQKMRGEESWSWYHCILNENVSPGRRCENKGGM